MTGCKSERQKHFESKTMVHLDDLYRFGTHLAGNTKDADDLVQETYLKAFRHWGIFEHDTNVRDWLFRILRNAFIDLYRREERKGVYLEENEGWNAGSGPALNQLASPLRIRSTANC